MSIQTEKVWIPDLLFYKNQFQTDLAIVCDANGTISEVVPANRTTGGVRLKKRALLPGLVNTHSHAFQRAIRGRTEYHSSDQTDSFWTWRELMYHAANQLSPYDIYAASRLAFLEMALGGITAVGEFHYLHNGVDGVAFDDPNLIAKEVVRAANDVGVRIALLRVAYARSGYDQDPNPRQSRFIELVDHYFENVDALIAHLSKSGGMAWAGVAPHSVRAVPLEYLKRVVEFGQERGLPIHMHVAEQPAEVSACIEEYGRSPVALLETEGLLSRQFTAVHAIHVSNKGINAVAQSGASVCACPTTERNLGDGVVPVDQYFAAGVPISLGTDSQTQIDLFEDARELEYHLRLQRTERNVLAPRDDPAPSALAKKLFEAATINGATCLGFNGGTLETDRPCDFFTIDLDDPTIAGASPNDLLSCVMFSLSRSAIKDVVVAGKRIVEDGKHAAQDKIVEAFSGLQKRLWSDQRA